MYIEASHWFSDKNVREEYYVDTTQPIESISVEVKRFVELLSTSRASCHIQSMIMTSLLQGIEIVIPVPDQPIIFEVKRTSRFYTKQDLIKESNGKEE